MSDEPMTHDVDAEIGNIHHLPIGVFRLSQGVEARSNHMDAGSAERGNRPRGLRVDPGQLWPLWPRLGPTANIMAIRRMDPERRLTADGDTVPGQD